MSSSVEVEQSSGNGFGLGLGPQESAAEGGECTRERGTFLLYTHTLTYTWRCSLHAIARVYVSGWPARLCGLHDLMSVPCADPMAVYQSNGAIAPAEQGSTSDVGQCTPPSPPWSPSLGPRCSFLLSSLPPSPSRGQGGGAHFPPGHLL